MQLPSVSPLGGKHAQSPVVAAELARFAAYKADLASVQAAFPVQSGAAGNAKAEALRAVYAKHPKMGR